MKAGNHQEAPGGFVVAIVRKFLRGNASVVLMVTSLLLGAIAVLTTPREEEPQIVVPLADIYVQFPGASAEEVEQLVATKLERLLWQIDGVEYVYSLSRPDMAVVTVRFYVGEDRERSLVKLHNKITANIDQVSPGITGWVVKPIEIDDVPIVTVTLYSKTLGDADLRRVGEEVMARLESLPDISRTEIVGGRRREVRVELDPERLAGMRVSAMQVAGAIRSADSSLPAGDVSRAGMRYAVRSGPFLRDADDVRDLMVGVHEGRPIYLRQVATVIDGPEEPRTYTRIGFGPGHAHRPELQDVEAGETLPAVTLALAKKKGTNAVTVARAALAKLEELEGSVIPAGVRVLTTRDYGRTANAKVNELLEELFLAIITVIGLISVWLGWREGLIVALAVPITFALTLFINEVAGYTINRVTLFALILSLGLIVDDPIVDVENIYRHVKRRGFAGLIDTVVLAVNEVRPPVVVATLAVIISFLPMFFITGMMGPYMRPMALNVPLAMLMSLLVAFTITPWATYQVFRRMRSLEHGDDRPAEEGFIYRAYERIVGPFLAHRGRAWALVGAVALLVVLSAGLALWKVPLKMLPFDNKDELQVVIDLPEDATLEQTEAVVQDFERYLATVNEVTDFESYIGTSSPIDFNGLVRHYYFRQAPHLADIRINFVPKEERRQKSHTIALRIRNDLQAIADRHGVRIGVVEVPPGPPVVATLVGEVTGGAGKSLRELIGAAAHVREALAQVPGVVDVNTTVEKDRHRIDFVLDKEKAALHGVDTETMTRTLRLALSGARPATVHKGRERNTLSVQLALPERERSSIFHLGRLTLGTHTGAMVPLAEIGEFRRVPEDQPIYHKNLERVVYVFADVAGRTPAEAVIGIQARLGEDPLPAGTRVSWSGEGEWKITLDVFRDLGIAFGLALLGIYILLLLETNSVMLPVIIMLSIPLTMIGIMPGFFLLNLFTRPSGGYADPVFFTATAMIGMIALCGIVVRGSLILIDFIRRSLDEGHSVRDAVILSGAVRTRPIFLTAGAAMLGAWPITLDPIFSGLAWALIFGLIASTLFTLLVIPVVYNLIYGRGTAGRAGVAPEASGAGSPAGAPEARAPGGTISDAGKGATPGGGKPLPDEGARPEADGETRPGAGGEPRGSPPP